MNKDTSIMTDKSGYYELHPPFFQRNLIAIDTDSDIIKSQLLTNLFFNNTEEVVTDETHYKKR